ncbi:uncharacterized protein STEHIDRAFT_57621 [Stereum hirsutum FP-91666 SS1]|uniref:uncharacterized protein n=1 Tax=Stereum hirsutum (strain FP-91666) TaxID=721885 RepID=UPI000440C87B|nr:uncharacterized protein STEHIDRAFT_57621 [Stereum hirsutum FP-91666 SS1]EIM86364.1 hypothetical protein STEHIDRAFT_57621 [Stereum hirsutum FP-91666 SS1]
MTSIHSTLGALEIGVLLMLLLFGIMIAQAYTYYQSQSTTDNRILRILHLILYASCSITETFHTGLMCADFYITSISDYGNITEIDANHWTGVFAQPVCSLSVAMIQCFYAWRIRCISRQWPITLISWLGSAVHVGTAIGLAVVSDGIPLLSTLLGNYRWLVCVCVSAAVAVDVLNMSAFCYWLCKRKSDFRQ